MSRLVVTYDMPLYVAMKTNKFQQIERVDRLDRVERPHKMDRVLRSAHATGHRPPPKAIAGRRRTRTWPTQNTECLNKSQCPKKLRITYNKCKVSKKEVKMVLRAIGIIVSSFGFLYQTTQLLTIYLSGRTSVDNRVELLKHSELPAITICLPTFMSMNKFANHVLRDSTRQQSRDLFEQYSDFRINFVEWNKSSIKWQKELHKKFITEAFPKENISLIDIFDKISVEELELYKFDSLAMTESETLVELSRPIPFASIAPFSDPRKCFTFFNEFDKNYRNKKFKLIRLEMRFKHDNHTFPVDEYYTGDFHIAIHSANFLPQYAREESFKNLRMNQINAISFSETRTTLLPQPYDTNCKVYQFDDTGQENMRSDCHQKCVDHFLLHKYPEVKCISTNANFKLVRRDNLDDFAHLSLCNYGNFAKEFNKEMVHSQLKEDHECAKRCLKNCRESFYDFTIDVIKGHSDITMRNEFSITLQHNRFPDQIIEHKPIMSWIELMSNFGGLLGMWLGLSVAFVFQYFIRFI